MYPILFKIGPITIYTYGFFVFLGAIAFYLTSKRKAAQAGIDKNLFTDIYFWMLVWGFIGARLLYILVEFKYFLSDPLAVGLARSGFVLYGGIIGGFLWLYFAARRNKINFGLLLDVIALGSPVGHALGRIGCFCFGCCYGRPTDSLIGVLFPPESPAGICGQKVIPTQLISAAFLFVLFFILMAINKTKRFSGQVALSYVIIYGIFRFIIEFFRADPRGAMLGLATSQWIAMIMVVASIVWWRRYNQ